LAGWLIGGPVNVSTDEEEKKVRKSHAIESVKISILELSGMQNIQLFKFF